MCLEFLDDAELSGRPGAEDEAFKNEEELERFLQFLRHKFRGICHLVSNFWTVRRPERSHLLAGDPAAAKPDLPLGPVPLTRAKVQHATASDTSWGLDVDGVSAVHPGQEHSLDIGGDDAWWLRMLT